jgi:hypothetical protein
MYIFIWSCILANPVKILRQYAVLASLIRKTFHVPANEQAIATEASSAAPQNPRTPPVQTIDQLFAGHDGPIVLNNDDPNQERLNLLLGLSSSAESPADSETGLLTPSSNGKSPKQLSKDDVKVDVTLRIQLGQAPALMLLITDQRDQKEKTGTARSVQAPQQIAICFEVGLNGRISVVDTAGLLDGEQGDDTEMQGADPSDSRLQDVQRKIVRVLELSQDLSILVEWVLRRMQQRGNG